MKLFLLYRQRDEADMPAATEVAERLRTTYSEVHADLPRPLVRSIPSGTLILLELPVRNCRVQFVQEDEQTWCMAPDYPVDAQRALAAVGAPAKDAGVLPTLCRELERRPEELLSELAPPFSVIWFSADGSEIRVQTDALGRSQLFEYDAGGAWALSNRALAFRALGLALRPEPVDWAVRFSTGHFLGDRTGFRELRLLEGGTQLRLTPERVRRVRHDVLSGWLEGEKLEGEDVLELARESLLRQVEAGIPLVETPRLGLSGGWDSRVLAAALRRLGARWKARVRGEPWRSDVVLAERLAKRSSVSLETQVRRVKQPPASAEECREAVRLSLLLSAGGRTAQSYKTYLAGGRRLRAGSAELTGHGGEIARSYYGERVRRSSRKNEDADELLVRYLTKKRAPSFLLKSMRDAAREEILASCRRADKHGFEAAARWDYFYLCERERRFIGSHGVARTGLELVPFLAPGFIRAAFRLPAQDKLENRIHRFILARDAPDWSDLPFKLPESPPRGVPDTPSGQEWLRPEGRHAYDSALYWQTVGRPLIDECLNSSGFWHELFDADAARDHWPDAPDELVIAALLPAILTTGTGSDFAPPA